MSILNMLLLIQFGPSSDCLTVKLTNQYWLIRSIKIYSLFWGSLSLNSLCVSWCNDYRSKKTIIANRVARPLRIQT